MAGVRRVLAPYIKRHVGALAGASACTVVLTAASLAAPWPLKLVIDHLVAQQRPFDMGRDDAVLLGVVVGLILLIGAATALSQYYADVWLKRAGEQIVHDLRVSLYAHLQRLSLAFHDTQKKGSLVTRLTGDVNSVGQLFSESLGKIVSAVLLLVGMATVSLIVDPVLALAVLGVSPALFLVTSRYRARLRDLARRQRAEEGEIASLANESLSAMQVVKAFGSEHFEHERVARRSKSRLAIGVQLSRTEARFSGLIDVLGAMATALVVVVGVIRVSAGHLTPGDLVVFAAYATKTYKPLRDIARQLGKVSRSMARAERVAEIMMTDTQLEERRDAYRGGRARGDLELRHVSFGYTDDRPALHDVSLKIPSGARTVIVGESGAGKSTLAALIARFYDPAAGSVSIDGRDLRDCELSWLRDQVGFLLQDTVLFSGTVADNIGYASDARYSEVVAAARSAYAHDFVTQLPGGYDTELGPRGVALSGGQRQRLGMARVLLRDPPVLVLDEPTAGLDTISEAQVMDGLRALMQGRTTIIITHSIALARTADRVVVLDNGRVIEDGTPDQLLGTDGAFHRLAGGDTDQHGRPPSSPHPNGAGRPAHVGAVPPPPPPPPPAPRTVQPAYPPPDPALPQLGRLLDTEAMKPDLRRTLRDDLGHASLDDLRIGRVRYTPRERVIVHYRTTIGRREQHAVVTAIAGQNLEAKVCNARFTAIAEIVNGRSPGDRPVTYDPDIDAVVAWLPFDVKLPGLAVAPEELASRLSRAGVTRTGLPDGLTVLGYKPASRAVLRFGDQILKVYAKDRQFSSAVTGLLTGRRAPSLPVPGLTAEFGDLRLTAQPVMDGSTPREAVDVAGEAGEFLRTLHAHRFQDLPVALPERQLAEAQRHANLAEAVAPELTPRLRALAARLERSMPSGLPMAVAHGDFHVDQLLADRGRLVVVDFDGTCMAPPALDVATYAADVVRGRGNDLDRVDAVLEPLCAGYGVAPDALNWYVSTAILCRATHPFRAQTPDWPGRVAAMVDAADEVLR